jgi:prepilin-type N-terminal cleavage/methylation domain-containing protein
MPRILKARDGVSLVEVIVAISLLSIVLTSLAGLSFTAARQTVTVAGGNYRHAVLTQEVNRLTAMPFAGLAAENGNCVNVAGGTFPHRRCITVTPISAVRAQVTVIVQPGVPGVRPDTIVVERTRPPVGNPLSTS